MIEALALLFSIGALSMYIGFIRNDRVWDFRTKLLDVIFEANEDRAQLLREYNSANYNDMVWQFWRPLQSFWDLYT